MQDHQPREAPMRKLTASFFISLDGVVEAPQNWHFPYFNDEMGAVVGEAIAASDTFLLGRRTYEEWSAFWPHQDAAVNPMAAAMNETPKVVVSTTLDQVEWQNSTLLDGDLAEAVGSFARMRAVLRRVSGPAHRRLAVRDLDIDLAVRVVRRMLSLGRLAVGRRAPSGCYVALRLSTHVCCLRRQQIARFLPHQ
jgi:hypothetical protein